jgi:hypothetical protein
MQEVFQADGMHTSTGEYTLFLTYTMTVLFGNKDTKSWTIFWDFMCRVHPKTIDHPQVTFMTDQDKGSIATVANVTPQAHNFHCSHHRCENIIKARGGGKGIKPFTTL